MNPKNSPALFSITTRLQPGVKPAAQIDEKLHAKPAPQPDPEPHAKPAPQPDAALSPYLRPAAKLPILLLILLLGCHSTQPVADDRYVDHNGVVTYVGPDWETTTNPFGWGMVGATTAAGAWLGTRGDGILGEGTSPFLSGLVGGVVGGGLTLLGNELLAPDPPGYWAADSVDWLAAMDERLLLVETAYRGGRHRLSGMYDTAWRSFTPKNAAELQTYIRAFGLAAYRPRAPRPAALRCRSTLTRRPPTRSLGLARDGRLGRLVRTAGRDHAERHRRLPAGLPPDPLPAGDRRAGARSARRRRPP